MRVIGWIGAMVAAGIAVAGVSAAPRTPDELTTVLAQWDRDEHPDLRGVVVLRDGRRVAERYYNDAKAGELHDIRSAGKSVTALTMGIAVDRGAVRSVDDRVDRYWRAATGSAIGDVRLRDVLTMRSGLAAFDEDPASPGNEDRMDEAADPAAFVLALPRADPPGSRYRYNSVTAYVAGKVVAEATGVPMRDFAARRLFAPLGIAHWRWDADAGGATKGQGNLWLSVRSLAAIGEMVRMGGRFHGRRIVGERWIAEALAPRVAITAGDPYADDYGYFWYRKGWAIAGVTVPVSFASGNGGNKVYVVPTCRMVVAITSSAYGHGYGQRRSEALLESLLNAEVAAGHCREATAGRIGPVR